MTKYPVVMSANTDPALNNARPMTPLDAPHAVYDAMGIPRIHAGSQPVDQQAAFRLFYPNGLPMIYNMDHGKDSGGVVSTYLENNLPVRFYSHPPHYAAAKFSTYHGEKPFRIVGDLLPHRRVHLWNKDELQSVCNSLRSIFRGDMKWLQRPGCWEHLWEFFDAHDLYHYGALNLWNLMNTLYHENCCIAQGWNAEMALDIGYFVGDWIKMPGKEELLKAWKEQDGPVWTIISADDWKKISNLNDEGTSLLRSALLHRRDMLLAGDDGPSNANKPPTDMMTACQSGDLVNWLGESPRAPIATRRR